jgi:flagellar hook-associated protein 2
MVGSIDFSGLISQLVALERRPIQALETKKTGATRQLSLLGDLAGKLTALRSQKDKIGAAEQLRVTKASSSNESRFTATSTDGASPGSYPVRVLALAQAETSQSATFASDTAGIAGAGTLQITVGAEDPVEIEWTGDDSLTAIARRINDSAARVTASVLFDGTSHRLLISGESAGADQQISFAETGDPLGFLAPTSLLQPAQSARIRLSGIEITRSSNHIEELLPGLSLDLVSLTPAEEADAQVTVGVDPSGLEAKLEAFVTDYNALASTLNAQLGAGRIADPTTSLQGDSTLRALQRRLSAAASAAYTTASGSTSLGRFGVKVGSDGTLSIDSSKLQKAAAEEPGALEALFAGDDGILARIDVLAEEYLAAGTGIIPAKQAGIRDRIEGYESKVARIEDHASSFEKLLRNQFAALEKNLSLMESQSSQLLALLNK